MPTTAAVLSDDPRGRRNLSDAILDRSALKRQAVAWHNRLLYGVLGYIDVPLVISGRDGWLFYRPQFGSSTCLSERAVAETLVHIQTLADLAAAAGLRLVVAAAPDKSTIYPEQLHPRARAYWQCKLDSATHWRRLRQELAPAVVDLGAAIVEARRSLPDHMYFTTDTHWTRLGAALGRRQLIEALAGEPVALPPPQVIGETLRKTDLDTMMLLDLPPEPGPDIASDVEGQLADSARHMNFGALAIVHDSFVAIWRDDFIADLPGTYLHNARASPEQVRVAFDEADTALFVVVERNLMANGGGVSGWMDKVGRGIVARNERVADGCSWSAPVEGLVPEPAPARAGRIGRSPVAPGSISRSRCPTAAGESPASRFRERTAASGLSSS